MSGYSGAYNYQQVPNAGGYNYQQPPPPSSGEYNYQQPIPPSANGYNYQQQPSPGAYNQQPPPPGAYNYQQAPAAGVYNNQPLAPSSNAYNYQQPPANPYPYHSPIPSPALYNNQPPPPSPRLNNNPPPLPPRSPIPHTPKPPPSPIPSIPSTAPPPYTTTQNPPDNKIHLYTTPISTLKALGITKPLDIVAHWTLCINKWCYELARQNSKETPYFYRSMPEKEWRQWREKQGKEVEAYEVGPMAAPYEHSLIDEVAGLVWERSLKKNYAYDEQNCQVFVRLLLSLLAPASTYHNFPTALDKWVRAAGTTRDLTAFGFAGGASLLAAGLSTFAVDPTGVTAAGFGIAALMTITSSRWLIVERDGRGKKILEGQRDIRVEMERRGRALVVVEEEGKKKKKKKEKKKDK